MILLPLGGFLPAAPYWKTYENLKPSTVLKSTEGTLLTPSSTPSAQKPFVNTNVNNNNLINNVNTNVNNQNVNRYIKPPNRLIAPGVQGITIPELSSEPQNPFQTNNNPNNPINPNPLRINPNPTSFAQAPQGQQVNGLQSQLPSPPITTTINSLINQNNQINQNNPTPAPQGILGEFHFSQSIIFLPHF